MIAHRTAQAIAAVVLAILGLSLPASAQESCPGKPNAHVTGRTETKLPDATIKRTTRCACNPGFESRDGACVAAAQRGPTIRDLAADPAAACLSAAQLQLVDGRLPGLRRSIAALAVADAAWEREREHILEERKEGWKAIAIEGANVVSLAGAQAVRFVAGRNVADAARVMEGARSALGQIPSEIAQLNRILSTTKDTQLAARILTYQGKLGQLHRVEGVHRTTERLVELRDSADAARGVYGMLKDRPTDADALLPASWVPPVPQRLNTIRNRLYMGSALLGGIAVAFVSVPIEMGAAIVGTVGFSALLAERELRNIKEETERLATIDREAANRNLFRLELEQRLAQLSQERERLAGVLQRSGPASNCPK